MTSGRCGCIVVSGRRHSFAVDRFTVGVSVGLGSTSIGPLRLTCGEIDCAAWSLSRAIGGRSTTAWSNIETEAHRKYESRSCWTRSGRPAISLKKHSARGWKRACVTATFLYSTLEEGKNKLQKIMRSLHSEQESLERDCMRNAAIVFSQEHFAGAGTDGMGLCAVLRLHAHSCTCQIVLVMKIMKLERPVLPTIKSCIPNL